MCACLLWIRGEEFDVDEFLKTSPWLPTAQPFRKGDASTRPHKSPRRYSGFSLQICSDDFATVADQMSACQQFIRLHDAEFNRLKICSGAQQKWFSLSYYLPLGEVMSISPHFSSDFLSDLVGAGMEFDFNVFLCNES